MIPVCSNPPHPSTTALADERYLIVSADFVRTGGMDLGNYHLANYLAGQGAAVHLVSHWVDPVLLAWPSVFFSRAPRPLGSNLIGEQFLRRRGLEVARKIKVLGAKTVVNGGNCPLPGVNWVHYVHAIAQSFGGSGTLRRAKNYLAHQVFLRDEAKAFARARILIANSRRTREDLLNNYPLDENKVRLVYYGTDPKIFYPPRPGEKLAARVALGLSADKFLVLFIGALGDRRKGFDTLFAAWKILAPQIARDAELVVIGTGAELPRWQSLAASSGTAVAQSIRFLGFRSDVPAILRAADAHVAPTRYEAFGLAVLEAVCCGLPTVVSRSAGVSEHYPSTLDGLLLENPADVDELVTKLSSLLNERVRWQELTVPVTAALRAYTWSDMAKHIHHITRE